MSKAANWKDTFRAGMYASIKLRSRKIHRDLLSYLVHSANQKVRFCWPSQNELARVCNCSTRNVHDLLEYLHEIGAIYPVRCADLPKSTQALIKDLTPNKITRNANAYYVCVDWAKDVLAGDEDGVPAERERVPNITPDARLRGSIKANARRQRYRPFSDIEIEDTSAEYDEWQILNAIPAETGSPTSPLNMAETGSGATDMTTEYNQAAISVPTNSGSPLGFDHPFSQAITSQGSISSPPYQPGSCSPHGYGGGEASACDPSPPGLARPEGKTKSPEQVAAGARANERRAS